MHPPKRGSWWKGTRPFVHRGFLMMWMANGLSCNIVDRMQRAVERMQGSPGKVKLYVTGVRSGQHALCSILGQHLLTTASILDYDAGACPEYDSTVGGRIISAASAAH